MSFTNKIPKDQISNYEVVNNFRSFFRNCMTTPTVERTPGGSILIENKIITEPIIFSNSLQDKVTFRSCYFLEEINFSNFTSDYDINFNQCFFDREVAIEGKGTKLDKQFNFAEAAIGTQLLVIDGVFAECKWSFIENSTIKISGGNFDKLIVGSGSKSKIKELSFDLRKTKGSIQIGPTATMEELSFYRSSSDISISIEDINVNYLSIHRFRNDKAFRILGLKPLEIDQLPTEFSIVESYLGKSEFYSIDLDKFDRVNILNSHIVDCSFVNMTWTNRIKCFKGRRVFRTPEEIQLEEKITKIEDLENMNDVEKEEFLREPTVIDYYTSKREVYRQIKYALSKQGDAINEQKFHSLELRTYDNTLHGFGSLGTKIILRLSFWLSDFGQSFARPLLGLFIGHWILTILLIKVNPSDNLLISFDYANYEGFKLGFEYYFKLINPLRRNEIEINGYATLIDILMRVWSSYMIYNIIRATRRFIK